MKKMAASIMYIVYHGRTKETGDARIGFISSAMVEKDGKLRVERG